MQIASMWRKLEIVLVGLALLDGVTCCSTVAVGRLASTDGSVYTTHSDDGEGNPDPRIVHVQAADHPVGTMRPIYPDLEDFPRHIGADRAASYAPGAYPKGATQSNTKPIGFVPEVEHTYSYWDTNYGVMNEYKVHIGESTCSGVFGTSAMGSGGKAIFSVNELSRLALSRCTGALCAVETMGYHAEKYGFYGAGSFEGTAESLLVGDAKEVWVFHVLPDSKAGGSAIWVAQRVPDDHVTGVFNMFTIREVDLTDTTSFRGSANMHQIALENHLWNGVGKLDFTKAFSDGEYAHKYYSGRRFWGAMRLLAPSLNLSPTYGNLKEDNPYPWSVKPDNLVNASQLFAIHRDHYANTPYDTSKGLAAGPYGNIDRWKVNKQNGALDGSFERTITLFRTTYSFVNQARPRNLSGVTWFGPHAAHGTVYVPLLSNAAYLPSCLTVGAPSFIDRGASWWAHRYLENQAHVCFNCYQPIMKLHQQHWEQQGRELIAYLEGKATGHIAEAMETLANNVLKAWWELSDVLMVKFADGFLDQGAPFGYTDDWLKQVGYLDGPSPIRPHSSAAKNEIELEDFL